MAEPEIFEGLKQTLIFKLNIRVQIKWPTDFLQHHFWTKFINSSHSAQSKLQLVLLYLGPKLTHVLLHNKIRAILMSHLYLIVFIPYLSCLNLRSSCTKPSLKIGTANTICSNSLGLFRDYCLDHIFFRNKTFFVFQDRKLKFSASV